MKQTKNMTGNERYVAEYLLAKAAKAASGKLAEAEGKLADAEATKESAETIALLKHSVCACTKASAKAAEVLTAIQADETAEPPVKPADAKHFTACVASTGLTKYAKYDDIYSLFSAFVLQNRATLKAYASLDSFDKRDIREAYAICATQAKREADEKVLNARTADELFAINSNRRKALQSALLASLDTLYKQAFADPQIRGRKDTLAFVASAISLIYSAKGNVVIKLFDNNAIKALYTASAIQANSSNITAEYGRLSGKALTDAFAAIGVVDPLLLDNVNREQKRLAMLAAKQAENSNDNREALATEKARYKAEASKEGKAEAAEKAAKLAEAIIAAKAEATAKAEAAEAERHETVNAIANNDITDGKVNKKQKQNKKIA